MGDRWEQELKHSISNDAYVVRKLGSTTVVLPCEVCHAHKERIFRTTMPEPSVIRRKLLKEGWRVGQHLICDGCMATRPKSVTDPHRKKTEADMTTILAPLDSKQQAPTVTCPAPFSPAALKVSSLSDLGSLVAAATPAPAAPPPAKPILKPLYRTAQANKTVATLPPEAAPEAKEPAKAAAAPASGPHKEMLDSMATGLDATGLSQEAKRARRSALFLLETEFDPDKGLYSKGWSDARVAEQTGCPPPYVAALRKSWFGELGEDPEAEQLRVTLAQLDVRLGQARAEARDAVTESAKLSRQMAATDEEIAKLQVHKGRLQKQLEESLGMEQLAAKEQAGLQVAKDKAGARLAALTG